MPDTATDDRRPWSIFVVFLRLGLTSFGGPVAHLGYFRQEFVSRRVWLTEAVYAELIALCQFLPGAASSKVGMALGLAQAGYRGALAVLALIALTAGKLPPWLVVLAGALIGWLLL